MLRLNLVNFETVCCIASAGTFGAAAARLHASQPAVTARVRELEASVGIAFFEKRGRRMELTIAGRDFIERVEPLVRRIEEEMQVHLDPANLGGVVRVGIAPVMLRWFPEAMRVLNREMPGVRYEVDVDARQSIIRKLEAGRLDIAIVAGQVDDPRLESIALADEELGWLMSSRIPRGRGARRLTTAQLLASAPIWVVPSTSVLYPVAARALERHGVPASQLNSCSHMSAIVDLIERTDSIGLAPLSMARTQLAKKRLVPVGDDLPPIRLEVNLACHRDQRQVVVRRVIRRLVELGRSDGVATATSAGSRPSKRKSR